MANPQTSSKGNMGAAVWILVIFVFGASWACDARELITASLSSKEIMTTDISVSLITHQESEKKVEALEEVTGNENICTLCVEFAAEALAYLKENMTQTEIICTLHKTCSLLIPFEQQCITLVDYYAPLFFSEIEALQPGEFCRKVNLCEQRVITSRIHSEDKCGVCHHAVAEVLLKLKDPDTQLEIIELLLKACDTVENYVKKCKTMVFQYGPLILTDAEQFLETVDICTAIHACELPSPDSTEASDTDATSMLSTM